MDRAKAIQNTNIVLVNRDKSFFLTYKVPLHHVKAQKTFKTFNFCLFCGFSKHHSGYVCIDFSPITGARKACATMELLAEENSCR